MVDVLGSVLPKVGDVECDVLGFDIIVRDLMHYIYNYAYSDVERIPVICMGRHLLWRQQLVERILLERVLGGQLMHTRHRYHRHRELLSCNAYHLRTRVHQ